MNSLYEDICIEVYIKNNRLLFHTLYRPPNLSIDFKQYFQTVYNEIDLSVYNYICSFNDLNIDFTLNNNRLLRKANELKEVLLSYNLHQIIQNPTYPSDNPKSILDLVFINNKNIINDLKIIPNISNTFDDKSILMSLFISKNKKVVKRFEKFIINACISMESNYYLILKYQSILNKNI